MADPHRGYSAAQDDTRDTAANGVAVEAIELRVAAELAKRQQG